MSSLKSINNNSSSSSSSYFDFVADKQYKRGDIVKMIKRYDYLLLNRNDDPLGILHARINNNNNNDNDNNDYYSSSNDNDEGINVSNNSRNNNMDNVRSKKNDL